MRNVGSRSIPPGQAVHEHDELGGEGLVYTYKHLALRELSDIGSASELGAILAKTHGIWSKEAEDYALATVPEL